MERYAFGVDVGGTTVKMGLFNMSGEKLDVWEIPTITENGGEKIIPDIGNSIRSKINEKKLDDNNIAGVGIGAPGAVDADGMLFQAVNLGWTKFNIKEALHAQVKLPVMAGNDANVAALGECWKGGGKGYSNMLLVTLGTGVGGGIIADGRIYTGATGSGGEIGHMHLEDDEPDKCGCGNHGCFEQYASATGAVRIGKRMIAATDKASVLRGKDFTCKDIFDAAKAGDDVATEIVEKYGMYLGKGLAACASILNPEAIVIGGGVSKCGNILFDILKPSFDKYVFSGCGKCEFKLAELGNDAGIFGAARMVIE